MILPVEWRLCKKEKEECDTGSTWTINVAAVGMKLHSTSLIPRLFFRDLQEATPNHKARIVVKGGGSVVIQRTTIARNIARIVIVAEEACRIAPGTNGIALAIQAGLSTEGGVLVEQLAVIVRGQGQKELGMPNEASRGIDGFKRHATRRSRCQRGPNDEFGGVLD